MKLYHGSNIEFDKIDLAQSKPNKDFGKGFYLSADYEQAAKEEMHLEGFYFSGIYVDDGIDLTGLTRERQLYITRQQLQSLLDLTLDRGIADQRMPVLLVDNVSRLVPMENLQKVQEILAGIEAQ